jgi:predicted transcriptional regulator
MTLSTIKETLDANVLTCKTNLDYEVLVGCCSDLMSDVLAFADGKVLLLTGLINTQVLRTAEMIDIKAVVFVRGKSPTPEMISLAEEKGMVLMNTGYSLYMAAGILFKNGLEGIKI